MKDSSEFLLIDGVYILKSNVHRSNKLRILVLVEDTLI